MSNKAEIIAHALRKQATDRLPCFPLIDIAFASSYLGRAMREVQLDPRLHARALSKCVRELPVDGIYVNLCLDSGQGERIGPGERVVDEALQLIIPENDVLSIASTRIDSLNDPRIETAELFHPGMLATFESLEQEVRDKYAVAVGITGTFSQLAFLMGISECMMALLDQPENLRQALDRRHRIVRQQVRQLCEAGAGLIWIGEGLGSGSLISPQQYRSFVLPYEIDLAEEIRRNGALSLLHICGNVTQALPDIAQSRADGFDLDYPVDLAAAMAQLLPQVAVKGNINPRLFLPGYREQLEQSCREARDIGGQRPGFILSTGCLVPRDSSVESFDIMAHICGCNSDNR